MRTILSCLFAINTFTLVFSQNIIMTNGGSSSACSGTFLDPGGTSNYSGQSSIWTYTICNPNPSQPIYVDFTSFSLWRNFCIWGASIDRLRVFNGSNTSAPLLGSWQENQNPGTIVGTGGCLTFEFTRQDLGGFLCDNNPGASGWSANISCTPPPPNGTSCLGSFPFCTGTNYNFPNSTNTIAPAGPNYDCLIEQPNPVWYHMRIDQAGSIQINISQTTGPNGTGSGLDVDFVLWGPFNNLNTGCASIMNGSATPIQSSYSSSSTETVGIGLSGGVDCSTTIGQTTPPPAQVGQYYILLITNFSGSSGFIQFSQTGGTASADCSFICGVDNLVATPSACDPLTNTYTLNGSFTITTPPTSGTLTITNTCGGTPIVYNSPLNNNITFSFSNLPANATNCRIDIEFNPDSQCNTFINYTSPAPCTPICTISDISINQTPCNNDLFNVSGNITFSTAPTTGELTILSSCGGTPIVLNAPFTSPTPYNFNGLIANGQSCSITATFNENNGICTRTQTFNAPQPCNIPVCVENPFCSNNGVTTFPAGTDEPSASVTYPGNNYGCLFTSPNPEWYYMQIDNGGNMTINMNNSAGVDIDYILYGPYPDFNTAMTYCNNFGNGNATVNGIVDCSYSGSATETADITGALPGSVYVLLITNFSNSSTNISFSSTGTATTDCSIVTPENCETSVGTFNSNLTGASNNLNRLCFGDEISITSNGDFVLPNQVLGGTNPPPYDPGVIWLIYSCPPSVALNPAMSVATNQEISDDPCLLGIFNSNPNLLIENDLSIVNTYPAGTFTNNVVYFVPLTMYSKIDNLYSYVTSPNPPCFELGNPVAIQFLPNISSTISTNCANGTASINVTGGLPQLNNSNFNLIPNSQSPQNLNFLNTSVSNGGTIVLSNLNDGNFGFSLIDANSCTHDVTGTFTGPQTANLTYPDNIYCLDEFNPSPTLIGTQGGTYSSGVGLSLNSTSGVINLAASTPGAYAITYNSPGPNCPATSTFNLSIEAFPNVSAGNDTTICLGVPIALNGSGAASYSWNNGVQNGVPYLPNIGLNEFIVTGTSINGCKSIDTIQVVVVDDCNIAEDVIFWVPNTFTPDGDQYNQTFKPIFYSGFDPYDFDLFIFNRWGEPIWESHDLNVGWDGSYNNGMKCPDGAYTWKIRFKLMNNDEKRTVVGHLNLLR
jgi:gliding motility-associated-like protein